MRCPYCGDKRTKVLKTVYRGHNSYRHRRCLYCGSRFSTQERPVRWSRVERKWQGPRPLRKGWSNLRTPALRGNCEVETCGVDFKKAGIRRHVDHIVPARLIRRLNAGSPDRRENLQCICGTCHGYKLQADHKLCMGDKLGYLEVRDPRIPPESLQALRKSGRLASLQVNHEGGKETSRAGIEQEPTTALDVKNYTSDSAGQSGISVKATRARRVWTEVARILNVRLKTVERLIGERSLKLYDPRITEKSFRNFCRQNGSLINGEFLDGETREWLRSSMDWDRSAGELIARRLNPFRKHALVVRRCTKCGRDIRGNAFFRHIKRCGSSKSQGIKAASLVDFKQPP